MDNSKLKTRDNLGILFKKKKQKANSKQCNIWPQISLLLWPMAISIRNLDHTRKKNQGSEGRRLEHLIKVKVE